MKRATPNLRETILGCEIRTNRLDFLGGPPSSCNAYLVYSGMCYRSTHTDETDHSNQPILAFRAAQPSPDVSI